MLIAMNGIWAARDPAGGVATYIRELVRGLGQKASGHRFRIYYDRPEGLDSLDLAPCFEPRRIRPKSYWVQFPITLPWELWRDPPDLYHAFAFMPPYLVKPAVATLFDIDWELYPDVFPWTIRLRIKPMVRWTMHRARKIIAISEFTKQQAMHIYGLPPDRFMVTHLGVESDYRVLGNLTDLQRVKRHYRTGDHFVMYAGKLQARKNVAKLVKAFALLKREDNIPHKLVLVGTQTWRAEELTVAIREASLGDQLVITGVVPRVDLVALYNAADLFVFPSLSEGFGLPLLEAMACGTPVIASNAASLPEVVGDAGILVDPFDTEGLARAIHVVLTDAALAGRLRRQGLERAATFSYDRMIDKTLAVYEEVGEAVAREQWEACGR